MSMCTLFRRLLAGLMLASVLVTASAWAQPTPEQEAEGKQLARDAFEAYKQSNYLTALEMFEKARGVYPTGQVLRMTGYTLVALERWVEAAETLEAALATEYKPLDEDVRAEVQEHVDKALSHVCITAISSEVQGATVSIDGGDPIELPTEVRLLEGTHTFVGSAEGHNDDERTANLPGGERFEIDLRPVLQESVEAPPPPPPKPKPSPDEDDGPSDGWFPYQKPIGFAVGGVGVALLGAGIASLAAGSSLHSATQENADAHAAAFGPNCSTGDYTLCYVNIQLINEDGEQADSLQTAGVAMTIVGSVLTATGVVFLVFAPWGDEEEGADQPAKAASDDVARAQSPAATVGCGPFGMAGVGCAGTF
ncbi:MAG: PEGA domain-containing protein [Deltaproteobacteria bacterium]|jgi:hypothetical protein|nr:PEGA domain-containing protein [Deltaproteobacteria bacterium]MBW2535262.1 PEGA domain-containing protein [Deltaproteobacteria bacterium]